MAAEKGLLFVGTFGSFAGTAGGRGIHVFARDRATGALTEVSEPYPVNGPSFLTVHPDLHTLYAADYQGTGGVRALAVEQGGQLRDLGWRAGGDMPPCHLTVTDDGRGLPPEAEQHGYGLQGLRARAAQVGGTLTLGAGEPSGATVRMEIPA